jgi:hypothetical protein
MVMLSVSMHACMHHVLHCFTSSIKKLQSQPNVFLSQLPPHWKQPLRCAHTHYLCSRFILQRRQLLLVLLFLICWWDLLCDSTIVDFIRCLHIISRILLSTRQRTIFLFPCHHHHLQHAVPPMPIFRLKFRHYFPTHGHLVTSFSCSLLAQPFRLLIACHNFSVLGACICSLPC